jgi:hypothetical protein
MDLSGGKALFVARWPSWRRKSMIHHSCDLCKRLIDSDEDLRYVVKIEVYAALDPFDAAEEDDRDNLLEMQEILERMEDAENGSVGSDVYQSMRFDLCPDCRRRFVKNPLGRESKKFNFSKN